LIEIVIINVSNADPGWVKLMGLRMPEEVFIWAVSHVLESAG
jgi:hypothetical protein